LLSYAWNKLDEAEKVSAGASNYEQIVDLFARLLINGCNRLFKQGLDRDYIPRSEVYIGIKGKIDFSASLKGNLFKQGKAICEFDEFESNVALNQILRATLFRLTKIEELDSRLSREAMSLYWRFQNVSDVELKSSLFLKARFHRNNSFYDLLIRISKMIFDATTLTEDRGSYLFKDFVRDERAMAYLFEEFVRNFYKKEMPEFQVSRPKIAWDAVALGESSLDFLPDMNTDICLESQTQRIIVDTKFYSETVSHYKESTSFHSNNLYQLYSYLRNLEADSDNYLNENASGLLLYPTVGDDYDERYLIGGHQIRIATVNLAKDWKYIDERLKYVTQLQSTSSKN
jgi:5-methylcytosine-specific restriction enzyme subunit McrC